MMKNKWIKAKNQKHNIDYDSRSDVVRIWKLSKLVQNSEWYSC
jgi:hypothetical protein